MCWTGVPWRIFFMCMLCLLMAMFICASKQTFSDPQPLTCYLYLLSALFSFCWAIGTELWKQSAVACANSLGSPARLLNPFHCRLTLMSPARLLQTYSHHSSYTLDQQTFIRTTTYEPLNTTLPLRASLMTLFCCTRAHLWPCALCPLSSFLPPSLPPFFFSPFSDPRGGITGHEHERQEREHPGERYVTFKHPHPITLSPTLG